MLPKSKIKYYSALKLKKHRTLENLFIVEGKRIVEEALNSDTKVELVIATNSFAEANSDWLESINSNFAVEVTDDTGFRKIADTNSPQGILCIARINTQQLEKPESNLNYIYLENISDPGNLGTIFRSCAWFNFNNILLSTGCADPYNPKVVRSSMGAIFNLNIFEHIDLPALKTQNSFNHNLYVADLDGADVNETKFSGDKILVFCNEAFGPTSELLACNPQIVTIPKAGMGESLNVSAASAIILNAAANNI